MSERLIRYKRARKIGAAILWLGPAIALMLFVGIYPLFNALILSLHKWELGDPLPYGAFVGLLNYARVLSSNLFWHSVLTTLKFIVGALCLEMFFGLAIALVFNRTVGGIGFFRPLLLLPMMIPPVVTGLVWRLIFNSQYGMLNYFLSLLRITPKGWLADPVLAMASVIVADVWQWTPFVVLICLSGLQTIPLEALEAARIDGANKSQELRYLVIPLLRNFLAVAFIFRAMDTIKMFDIIYIMTEGGPGTSTEVLSTYIYRVAFRNMHADQAAAMSYITLLLLSVFAMLFIRQWRNAR